MELRCCYLFVRSTRPRACQLALRRLAALEREEECDARKMCYAIAQSFINMDLQRAQVKIQAKWEATFSCLY